LILKSHIRKTHESLKKSK